MRKQRSDSTARQLASAQAADLTTAIAPMDVPSAEFLNPYGRKCYDQLFRSRSEWSLADLTLISQAALCLQMIAELQPLISLPGTQIITNPNTGVSKANPAIALINDQRRLVQNLLRDAGLRQRDGSDKRQPQSAPAIHSGTSTSQATAKHSLTTDDTGAPDWDSLMLQ
ncbi:MAG: hypothetical protein ABJO27_14885 [Pseudoruegeria sp.]